LTAARKAGRTAPCSRADARARLEDARDFALAAQAADNNDVIASNAILAAIAAADVLCGLTLGVRASSPSHFDAVTLLERVDRKRATDLRRCLDVKTKAAYDAASVSKRDATGVLRMASTLVVAAQASWEETVSHKPPS
jgi:hypothetical protein